MKLRLLDPVQLLDFDEGGLAWVDLRDSESRAHFLARSFWPEIHPITAAFLQSGGEMFDVGANFGLVSFGALSCVGGTGTGFHLFEANPSLVPILERSVRLWPGERVAINHCCASDVTGTSCWALESGSWGTGHIAAEGVSVPNLRLDDYIARTGIGRISFMKMDIEGSEVAALRGCRRALEEGKVEAGLIEIAPQLLRRNGESVESLMELLRNLGFGLFFCSLWDHPDPFGLRWVRVPISGTSLRFATADPLPIGFVQGDLLVLHASSPYRATVDSALGRTTSTRP